jgi:hypothetical protein
MIKHVGRHGDKKIVILYRTVPGEDHMCLVAYSDLLPRTYHDAVMKTLETPAGQQAKEFADALFRNLLPDGRNMLHTLHREGLIKKVPTNQVIVTPDTKSNVRLDELNDILKKMEEGEDAVRKMAAMDAQAGLRDPIKNRKIPAPAEQTAAVLNDSNLAQNLMAQATRMKTEAQSLLTEAARLETEAQSLTSVSAPITTKKGRGRNSAKKSAVAK